MDYEGNGEEASFNFMIMDFEHWLKKDGAEFVLKHLDEESFNLIYCWFNNHVSKRGCKCSGVDMCCVPEQRQDS